MGGVIDDGFLIGMSRSIATCLGFAGYSAPFSSVSCGDLKLAKRSLLHFLGFY